MPEPSITPDEPFYDIAGCGHEVYEGEAMIEWDDKTICPDCFRYLVGAMSIEELAIHLRFDYKTVERR